MGKMSLSEAGALLGLSTNGMRSRAKKDPSRYGLEADNTGKLWVSFDAEAFRRAKPARSLRVGFNRSAEKPAGDAEFARLTGQREAALRSRDQAEAELARLSVEREAVLLARFEAEAHRARLTVEVEALKRACEQAEIDRDHWRRMAEALAARRSRWWPF